MSEKSREDQENQADDCSEVHRVSGERPNIVCAVATVTATAFSCLVFSLFAPVATIAATTTTATLAPVVGSTQAVDTIQVEVRAQTEMDRLLKQVDIDGDKRITIDDLRLGHAECSGSSKRSRHSERSTGAASTFWLRDIEGRSYEVSGVYPLANLLQELKLAIDHRSPILQGRRIFENPVERISRSIREIYWDSLTRRVDAENLEKILPDSKLPKSEWRHLYVPAGDPVAFEYFSQAARAKPELKLKVWRWPGEMRGRHGVLALALEKRPEGGLAGVSFVVPGGRFNEMYGWDSYFEALGLLVDGRLDLAKAMVDNFVYQINHYGKILNANRSYYLNRSQPPFLTSMITAVHAEMAKTIQIKPEANKIKLETKLWLQTALRAAIKEYFDVWLAPERLTETGLSRYAGTGRGIPPEVEPGHFDHVLRPSARRHGLTVAELEKRYNAGTLKEPELDAFFAQDLAVRESGHDTTYRWTIDGRDRASDFVTVDLNSLLYKYELDIARLIEKEFGGRFTLAEGEGQEVMTGESWRERARRRKALMLQYLWNPKRKMFFDFCFKCSADQARSSYVSATAFYPLWAQDPADPTTRILEPKDAEASVRALLAELEAAGGVAATSRESLAKFGDPKRARQWDFPNGWAPHQMIIWEGLGNYGFTAVADRLIYKWLYTITKNAVDYNGTVPEKFDVVKRSHAVFAEYGNVGTDFAYITREGFGWMNASYQVGLKRLSPKWRPELEKLKPPEWLVFE